MTNKKPENRLLDNKNFSILRQKAKEILASRQHTATGASGNMDSLLDELEMYELELQMQNDELRASQVLLESEREKFAMLFETAPVGYVILDELGVIQKINKQGVHLLQRTESMAMIGKNFSTFITEDSHCSYYALLREITPIDSHAQREIRILTHDDTICFLQIDATRVKDISDDKSHYFITLTDITMLKKIEHNLKQTSTRLNQTLEASETGIWMVNLFNKRIYFDAYGMRILGLKEGQNDIPLSQLAELVIEKDRKKLESILSTQNPDYEIDIELRHLLNGIQIRTLLIKGRLVKTYYESDYLAGVLVDITERKRYQAKEEQYKRAQERLLQRKLIEAQEKERERISATLHDSVCQTLYGIKFNLSHLSWRQSDTDNIKNIQKLLGQAIEELRSLSHELKPSVLKDFGFIAGVSDMVHRLESLGFKVRTNISKQADQLPAEIQLYIFRIVQELLNNSIKHSGANTAEVTLTITDDIIVLKIYDTGVGFDSNLEELITRGSGLRSITNRVSLLGGQMTLTSAGGALFQIQIPYPIQENAYEDN